MADMHTYEVAAALSLLNLGPEVLQDDDIRCHKVFTF